MSESHILIISPFFFPEKISSGRYNTILAVELARRWGNVKIICSQPFYPSWHPHPTTETLDQVDTFRAGTWIRYPKSNILKHIVLELWFALHAIRSTFRQRRSVTAVIIIFPPVLFAPAIRLLLPRKVPIIGILHDLQGIMARTKETRVRRAVGATIAAVERRAFKACSTLIALSEGMKKAIIDEYAIAGPSVSVCYPFAHLSAPSADEAFDAFADDFHHVVYAGALGEKQMPELLLAVMEFLVSMRSDVVCHIFSAGAKFELLQKRASGRERLRFHGLVDEDDLVQLYAGSSVQIIPQAPETGAGAFPSKLPNLVLTGTPIFAICQPNSELHSIVKRLSCARSSHEQSVPLIAEALSIFLNEIAEHSHRQCAESDGELCRDLFSVQCLTDRLDKVLSHCNEGLGKTA